MAETILTAAGTTAVLAVLIALLVILVRPIRRRFTALDPESQQVIVGICIAISAVVGAYYAMQCASLFIFTTCAPVRVGEYEITVVIAAVVGDRMGKAVFASARWVKTRRARIAGTAIPEANGSLLR